LAALSPLLFEPLEDFLEEEEDEEEETFEVDELEVDELGLR